MKKILSSDIISYTVCPVTGGPVQSKEGTLGGIWGGDIDNFNNSKILILPQDFQDQPPCRIYNIRLVY